MANIEHDIVIDVAPGVVWDAVRDVGAVHKRLAPGLVTDSYLDGEARVVTFANGACVRELIVEVDDSARRFVWAIVGAPVVHHQGSMQVFAEGEGRSRLVWITDILPAALVAVARPNMEQGMVIIKRTLERAAAFAA